MSEDKKWIRLEKRTGQHWPFFVHPEYPDAELALDGAFHVRWPEGTVTIEEIQRKNVGIMGEGGKLAISGVFMYFEREFHKMDLVYELHEIELLDEEVARCVINPSQAVAAV